MKTMENGLVHRSLEVVDQVSICQPAVRTLLLQAWAWWEDGKYQVGEERFPVLALQATTTRHYSIYVKRGERADHSSVLHKDLVRAGWDLSYQATVVKPIVADTIEVGCGNNLTTGEEMESSNCVTQVVACYWPPQEDELYLRPLFQKLIELAKEKEAASRKGKESA